MLQAIIKLNTAAILGYHLKAPPSLAAPSSSLSLSSNLTHRVYLSIMSRLTKLRLFHQSRL